MEKKFVSIQAPNGKYLRPDRNHDGGLFANSDKPYPFELTPQNDKPKWFSIHPVTMHKMDEMGKRWAMYISATRGGGSTVVTENSRIGDNEQFKLDFLPDNPQRATIMTFNEKNYMEFGGGGNRVTATATSRNAPLFEISTVEIGIDPEKWYYIKPIDDKFMTIQKGGWTHWDEQGGGNRQIFKFHQLADGLYHVICRAARSSKCSVERYLDGNVDAVRIMLNQPELQKNTFSVVSYNNKYCIWECTANELLTIGRHSHYGLWIKLLFEPGPDERQEYGLEEVPLKTLAKLEMAEEEIVA